MGNSMHKKFVYIRVEDIASVRLCCGVTYYTQTNFSRVFVKKKNNIKKLL